jgi:hypothetical protein
MSIALKTICSGNSTILSILGHGDMIYCFFSNISFHLEGIGNWGRRFPILLLHLCDYGIVENEYLLELQKELDTIEKELKKYSIKEAIYDLKDLSKTIPWKTNPGAENDNLSQPWQTLRGNKSYFEIFREYISHALKNGFDIYLNMFLLPIEEISKREFKGREYWLKYTPPTDQ